MTCPNATSTLKHAICANATFNSTGYQMREIVVPANSYCLISITNAYGVTDTPLLTEAVAYGKSVKYLQKKVVDMVKSGIKTEVDDVGEKVAEDALLDLTGLGEIVDIGKVVIKSIELLYDVAEWIDSYYQNVTNIAALPSSHCLGAVYTETMPLSVQYGWTYYPNISRPSTYNGGTSMSSQQSTYKSLS